MGTELKENQIFAERFVIQRQLGMGGMGTVYLAKEIAGDRLVALKILNRASDADDIAIERFIRECQILARLNHLNIVNVFSMSAYSGTPFAVCEYVPGSDSAKTIHDYGSIEWRRAVKIANQICHALDYAHKLGVIHRDLKPSNIILVDSPEPDTVKIVDFGLAAIIRSDKEFQRLTLTGELLGTPQYMSPEQVRGIAEPRSDLYSLACIIFEMLSGTKLIPAENVFASLYNHQHINPESRFSEIQQRVPGSVLTLLKTNLQKIPEQRSSSAQEFSAELEQILNSSTLTNATIEGTASRFQLMPLIIILLIVGLSSAFLLGQSKQRRTSPPVLSKLSADIKTAENSNQKEQEQHLLSDLDHEIKLQERSSLNRCIQFAQLASKLSDCKIASSYFSNECLRAYALRDVKLYLEPLLLSRVSKDGEPSGAQKQVDKIRQSIELASKILLDNHQILPTGLYLSLMSTDDLALNYEDLPNLSELRLVSMNALKGDLTDRIEVTDRIDEIYRGAIISAQKAHREAKSKQFYSEFSNSQNANPHMLINLNIRLARLANDAKSANVYFDKVISIANKNILDTSLGSCFDFYYNITQTAFLLGRTREALRILEQKLPDEAHFDILKIFVLTVCKANCELLLKMNQQARKDVFEALSQLDRFDPTPPSFDHACLELARDMTQLRLPQVRSYIKRLCALYQTRHTREGMTLDKRFARQNDDHWDPRDFHTAAFAAEKMLQNNSGPIDFEKLNLLLDSPEPLIRRSES